ncbi:MAG: hypothetical protein V4631_00650 [Pseudomonadota bacterium]
MGAKYIDIVQSLLVPCGLHDVDSYDHLVDKIAKPGLCGIDLAPLILTTLSTWRIRVRSTMAAAKNKPNRPNTPTAAMTSALKRHSKEKIVVMSLNFPQA